MKYRPSGWIAAVPWQVTQEDCAWKLVSMVELARSDGVLSPRNPGSV